MNGQRSISPEDVVLPADARGLSEIRHELRTHLNHIVGYSEMVLEDADERRWSTGRRSMEDILEDAQDLTQTTANLLHALEVGDRVECSELINSRIQPAVLRIKRLADLSAKEAERLQAQESAGDIANISSACERVLGTIASGLQPATAKEIDRTPMPSPAGRDLVAEVRSGIDGDNKPRAAHVLAVDDNSANLALLERFCLRRGHTFTGVKTGEEALQFVQHNKPDLMILDIMLPGINGFEVLEKVRESAGTRLPVIVLSSLDDMESMVTCLRMGAEDFIRKPFVSEILEARIQAQLDRSAAAGDESGPVSVAESNPHKLSRREIEVLAHLAMGKSNREIGEDLFISENTVVRHVSSIFTKADLGNRAEAGVYAVRLGLVGLGV